MRTEVTIELGLRWNNVHFDELAPMHDVLALRQFGRRPDECFYQSASPLRSPKPKAERGVAKAYNQIGFFG